MAHRFHQNKNNIWVGLLTGWKSFILVFFIYCPNSNGVGISTSPEGLWLGDEKNAVFLQNFSPYPLIGQLMVLGGTKFLSSLPGSAYQHFPASTWLSVNASMWWHYLGNAAGLAGGGWYLSSVLDSLELVPGQETRVVVELGIPEVSSRLLISACVYHSVPVLIILRNPLVDPVPIVSGADGVTRALLALHKEMSEHHYDRIEIIPFQDIKGSGLRMGWRDESGQWFKFNLGERFSERDMKWLSMSRDPISVISMFQPQILDYLVKVIKNGRSAGVSLPEILPPLAIERAGDNHWSVIVDSSSPYPVVLEGVDSHAGAIRKLKLFKAGFESEGGSHLYRVARHWTALAQVVINLASLMVDLRPVTLPASGTGSGVEGSRYSQMQLKKVGAGAGGLIAGVTKKGPRQAYTIIPADDVHDRRAHLKDSNRVIFGEGTYQELIDNGVELPCRLELSGAEGAKAWAMPHSETAPPGTIMLSNHLLRSLKLKHGDMVSIQPVELKAGNKAEFKIISGPYRSGQDLVEILSNGFVKYPTLKEGENIYVSDATDEWQMVVKKLGPEKVVSALNVNLAVDFERPDYWPSEEEFHLAVSAEPFAGKGETLGGHKTYNPPSKKPVDELPPSSQVDMKPRNSRYFVNGKPVQVLDASTQHEYAPVYLYPSEEFKQMKDSGLEREREETVRKSFENATQTPGTNSTPTGAQQARQRFIQANEKIMLDRAIKARAEAQN